MLLLSTSCFVSGEISLSSVFSLKSAFTSLQKKKQRDDDDDALFFVFSSVFFGSEDAERAEKTERGERFFFVGFGREVRRYNFHSYSSEIEFE